jgi:hypothetical protein
LLEIIPWEAHEHIFGADFLFEWQVMVNDHHQPSSWTWKSQLKYFPTSFANNLSIVAPATAVGTGSKGSEPSQPTKDRSTLLDFLAGTSSGSSNAAVGGFGAAARTSKGLVGTITDEMFTCLYNLEAGYPLPTEGTWEWIGGWRVVVKKCSASSYAAHNQAVDLQATTHLDCDSNGWSYAREPQHFLDSPALVWDSPCDHRNQNSDDATIDNLTLNPSTATSTTSQENSPIRTFRRRKWIRRRMLVDYPYASERTKQYLKVLAENARISITLDKVSTQLVETKTRLTESEAELMRVKSELFLKESELHSIMSNGGITKSYSGDSSSISGSMALKSAVLGSVEGGNKVLHEILSSKADLGSKLSQWVHSAARKGSEDMSSSSTMSPSQNRPADVDTIGDASRTSKEANGALEDDDGSENIAVVVRHKDELSDSQHSRFDWKKIGRGSLLERLAKGHHRASETSTISTVRSSGSASIPEDGEEVSGDTQ